MIFDDDSMGHRNSPKKKDTPSQDVSDDLKQSQESPEADLEDKSHEDDWPDRFTDDGISIKKAHPALRLLVFLILASLTTACTLSAYLFYIYQSLPSLEPIQNYNPQRVSIMYDRNEKVVDTFFKQKRKVTPLQNIPTFVQKAFIASEDDRFLEHSGLNYTAILRAAFANLKAGRKVQGASTITQQVAKIFLLTFEKTYTRKLKEFFLARQIEALLSKEDILFLYLNQIYLGNGAYGVAQAAETYFRKNVTELSLSEAALLAGLPQAPSKYAPSKNPLAAKTRQIYVLNRMRDSGFITDEELQIAQDTPVTVYNYTPPERKAPYFKSLVEQVIGQLLEDDSALYEKGLKIYTTLDFEKQQTAQQALVMGLKATDKRQGFRGPLNHISDPLKAQEFTEKSFNHLKRKTTDKLLLLPTGEFPEQRSFQKITPEPLFKLPPHLPENLITEALVLTVDDRWGLTTVQIADYEGLIDIESMTWARKPNPPIFYTLEAIKKPSTALKEGDVILVKIIKAGFESKRFKKEEEMQEDYRDLRTYIELELEQEPIVQGALLSLDAEQDEVLALVGGYNFKDSQFNRVLQALRQTGSTFKPLVYMAALDYGLLPNTKILDAPIVFKRSNEKAENTTTEQDACEVDKDSMLSEKEQKDEEAEENTFSSLWKPQNSSAKFSGQILLRNALIRSKNIPTIKLTNKMGVNWIASYARRMGLVNTLNQDLTLGLGSSGLSLYEVTKLFTQIAKLGKRSSPIFITSVRDNQGNILLKDISLDYFIKEKIEKNNIKISILKQAFQLYKEARQEDALGSLPTKVIVEHPKTGESISIKTKDIPHFFFENSNQLISPQTTYVLLSMLKGVIFEPRGTGRSARSLRRPAFGKTGTTNGYYDAWFVGSTPQVTTGVWVGFDEEKTLGRGEVGSRTALPIWLNYMKFAHKGLIKKDFEIPANIIITNIDVDTGLLPTKYSTNISEQAFLSGTEPTESEGKASDEENDFLKEGL